jgi:hypothetical protein
MTTPILEAKPTYPEFFDLVAGLPPEIKSNICYLLLWIWRHTNSDRRHENFGKAWVAHPNLAREMHASRTVIPEWFNEAWAWGLINREHLFKKKGKVIVSDAPYRMKTSHGRGEYLGSRYWIDWAFLQELQVKVVPESDRPIGVPENGRPNELGYRNPIAQTEIGVPENSTPLPESGTKGLIEGFDLPPQQNCPSVEAREGEDKSEGHVVVSGLPKNQRRGQENPPVSQEDRTDAFLDARRARQLERKTPDAEIFREYKKVYDRLEREYQARENFERKCFDEMTDYTTNPKWAAMPKGAHFEKPFIPTTKHIHDAAELYRSLGRDVTLAKWEDFLVNENHETTTRVPLFDEGGEEPTGEFISETVERTWLLYDFVLYCGVSSENRYERVPHAML